jgi:transposase InsO family protein
MAIKYKDFHIKRYESVRELCDGVARYFRFYNIERFHRWLGYLTPEEMYQSFQVVDLVEQAGLDPP